MADDIVLNAGSGGATLATDDIGGIHHQRVKVQWGVDGVATDVSNSNPLPISDGGGTITIGGTVTANAGTNLNTSALALETGGNLATLAGAVSGSEMQVDVIASLPTGTNSIGQVTANAGTNLNTSALALETGGNLATLAGAVSGTEFQVDVVASLPTGTNSIGAVTANAGTGTFTVDNAGTFAVQATLAAETTKVIGTINVAAAQTIAVTNAGTFATQATLQSGSNSIGTLGANSGVDIGDVDVTSISAGSNLVGDVGLSGARTSGGTTLYKNIDVDESEDQVKGTAGQVYWIQAVNLDATPVFLKFYNATAASVTVGTTVPDLTFAIPSQGDANGAGFVLSIPNGIAFSTAITIAATTGVADNDAGAPGANEVIVNIGYA